jgi:hypothetical protein
LTNRSPRWRVTRPANAPTTRRIDLIRLLDSFPQGTNQPGTMSPTRLRAALGLE